MQHTNKQKILDKATILITIFTQMGYFCKQSNSQSHEVADGLAGWEGSFQAENGTTIARKSPTIFHFIFKNMHAEVLSEKQTALLPLLADFQIPFELALEAGFFDFSCKICYNGTMDEQLRKFVSSRRSLFWSVEEPESLSLEAVVETILNFGDWQDFQQLLELAGKERVAEIFQKQTSRKRNNYRAKIANYFSLYFQKYAR